MREGDKRFRVLLGSDGEAPSLEAEDLVRAVAHRDRVEVYAVSVNSFEMSLHQSELLDLDHYSPEAGYRHALEVEEGVVQRMQAAGVQAHGQVRDGDPAAVLLAEVGRSGSSMIAAGAGRARWGGIPMLGRVVGHLLHEAPAPVMMAHTCLPAEGSARVLVATDGSPGAAHALETFAAFADPGRCSLLVVSVARVLPASPWAEVLDEREAVELVREEAQRRAEAAAAVLRGAGFSCTIHVPEGRPAEQLLQFAEKEGAHLVVAGSRGLGTLKRAALGSVSDKLARHAVATLVGRPGPTA